MNNKVEHTGGNEHNQKGFKYRKIEIYTSGLKLGTLIIIKEGFKKMNIIRYLKDFKQVRKWNLIYDPSFSPAAESNCFNIVKMIMERNFAPVIVFSFSKKDCEAYALQMSKLNFNSEEEKALVDEVFNNAIDNLSDDDKKLPQVNVENFVLID